MTTSDESGRVLAEGSAFTCIRVLLMQCTAAQRQELARLLTDMAKAPSAGRGHGFRPLEEQLRERERKGLPLLKLLK